MLLLCRKIKLNASQQRCRKCFHNSDISKDINLNKCSAFHCGIILLAMQILFESKYTHSLIATLTPNNEPKCSSLH